MICIDYPIAVIDGYRFIAHTVLYYWPVSFS